MVVKAYINNDQTATFVCPQCQKPLIKNVSKYVALDEQVRLKVKCSCGHQFKAVLEKRKKFRKSTTLDGRYKYSVKTPDNRSTEVTGRMTVTDLSFTGLRVKLPIAPRFAVGDKLTVEFKLDDQNQTLVSKEVIVQNITGLYAGFEFIFNQSYDPSLGFYLLSKS